MDGYKPALPCIVCGRGLTNAVPGDCNQPADGTEFKARGHYGSGVIDPVDGPWTDFDRLTINVCDPCLTEAGRKGRVGTETDVPLEARRPSLGAWAPEGEW